MKLFGGGKSDHPMADVKEARKIVDAIPGSDPFKALEDLNHWLESVRAWKGFAHDHRAQLVLLIDDAAQGHLRRLQRDYLSSPRLSKYQENRLWTTIRESYRESAIAFATCVDVFVTSQKGWEILKPSMALLTVRALHSLAGQMKWQYIRYGLQDVSLWGSVNKIYAFAEHRRYADARVALYADLPGDSSAREEFLKAVMLAVSSPDSLLPVEIELVERLVAHLIRTFKLTPDPQPDSNYGTDLAATLPPVRIGRSPEPAPPLRFFSAAAAVGQIRQLIQVVKTTNAIPSSVNLGGSYEPGVVLEVLDHLAVNWSSQPPERKAPRHRVKSRVTITYGFDGVLSALDPGGEALFDPEKIESWIVENVSSGGFGALVPQLRGDWLRIGCLLGLQPEGGSNWIVGVVRRFQRDMTQTGAVGIQTVGRAAVPAQVRLVSGPAGISRDTETAILLGPLDSAPEAQLLLRTGVLAPGQNLQLEQDGRVYLLLPTGAMERGDDYDLVRCRTMRRDSGE
ncbi:MAG TPA: hypothetical protein VJO54_01630 [Burkholderiales bacterium]|nr:hypothetical protein [Burkholderiales bacterium]